jgi:hypothetical protein
MGAAAQMPQEPAARVEQPSARPAHHVRPQQHMTASESTDPSELLALVGSESAALLGSALERVNSLAHSGRIDRAGLRALREEIERARRAAMLAQQISRISSDRVRLYEEKVDLTSMVQEGLQQRTKDFEQRGLEIRQLLTRLTVVGDVTVMFALTGALLDWCQEHARDRLDVTLDLKEWPAKALLCCAYPTQSTDRSGQGVDSTAPVEMNSLSWRLVEACARKLQLELDRREVGGKVQVELGFPKTLLTSVELETMLDASLDDRPSRLNSRPLAGSHVLVVCARRDLRVEVREAVQSMGVMLDFVGTVEEAREFCTGGLPHAIVYDASAGASAMHRLMAELRMEPQALSFIEITESGRPLQAQNVGGHELTSVSRPSLRESLPTALTMELTRHG